MLPKPLIFSASAAAAAAAAVVVINSRDNNFSLDVGNISVGCQNIIGRRGSSSTTSRNRCFQACERKRSLDQPRDGLLQVVADRQLCRYGGRALQRRSSSAQCQKTPMLRSNTNIDTIHHTDIYSYVYYNNMYCMVLEFHHHHSIITIINHHIIVDNA